MNYRKSALFVIKCIYAYTSIIHLLFIIVNTFLENSSSRGNPDSTFTIRTIIPGRSKD